MRVTVGTVVGLVAAGRMREEILREYPYLEAEDIAEASSTPRGAPRKPKSPWTAVKLRRKPTCTCPQPRL